MAVQAVEVTDDILDNPDVGGCVALLSKEATFSTYKVATDTGIAKAITGDFLIIGTNDEVYPCRREIFHKIYDEVEVDEEDISTSSNPLCN